MPRFRLRNLLIDVLPPQGEDHPGLLGGCAPRTFCTGPTMMCGPLTGCAGQTLANCGPFTVCGALTRPCLGITVIGGCDAGVCTLTPCTDTCTRCTEHATKCHTPTTARLDLFSPGDLAMLKAELVSIVEAMDEHERREAERGQPQTADEAAELEAVLSAALADVRARKEELGSTGETT
jgi:hypothetical protein